MSKATFKNFYEITNPDKYWKIKDTYVVTMTTGNYWSLKKYIVYYINFYINRGLINSDTLKHTYLNFSTFVDSIKDDVMHEYAKKYFLDGLDFKTIIPYSDFNDMGNKYDHHARSMYVVRLLGIGGQSGIKEYIKDLLNKNKTLSEIISLVDKRKDYYIKNNVSDTNTKIKIVEDGKTKEIHEIVNSKGEKTQIDSTLSDFYAAFSRNTRQVYSKLGFLPPNADGIVHNQISKLIFDSSNEVELNTICEHQKLKYRIGNPQTDNMISNYDRKNNINLIKKYSSVDNACKDFYVSPFFSIMQTLNAIIDDENLENYITEREYQFIVSKISPFNIETCINLIKDFRSTIHDNLENRSKKRNITEKKVTGGFTKPLAYLFYGYLTKKTSKNDLRKFNNKAFIEYLKGGKYEVIDNNVFKAYYSHLSDIQEYLDDKYQNLYDNISYDYEMKLTNEYKFALSNERNSDNKQVDRNYNFEELDSIGDYLQSWSNYIQTIDVELFNKIIQLNKLIYPYDYFYDSLESKKDDNYNDSENILSNNVIESLAERSGYVMTDSYLLKDRTEFNKIKEQIKSNRINGTYKGIRYHIDPNSCDSCGTITENLDCHHIIPHRIGGPDVEYNLTFLCKKCHDSFTFLTKEKSVDNSINREDVIYKLRIKGFFSFDHIIKMINQQVIESIHLDYLFNDGYITFSERLELKKKFIESKKILSLNNVTSNRFDKVSNKRWGRLMKEVFFFRMQKNYIFGRYDFDYPINQCDGGCGKIIDSYCECHHIIPKKGSNSNDFKNEYGTKPLNGPESEFNYLFLCEQCHLEFTNHTPKRKEIIKKIREKNLLNYETMGKLITSACVDICQLRFLFNEGFIDETTLNKLEIDINSMRQNQ